MGLETVILGLVVCVLAWLLVGACKECQRLSTRMRLGLGEATAARPADARRPRVRS